MSIEIWRVAPCLGLHPLDEKATKAMEAMLRDSRAFAQSLAVVGPIVEASAPRGVDLVGTSPTIGVTCGAELLAKKTKVLASKEVPHKDTPP
ncbi:hypothetical protein BHE74_00040932 [Ensete ventricosum]|nr:hypothetical protein BHE74_00040932 [Ensete ventricosum]